MTPDAVIFRYLQLLLTQDVEIDVLCRLICADADLLQRWLNMFDLGTDLKALKQSLAAMQTEDLRNLAHVQAWSLAPSVGSARLSLDLWRSVLQSAYLAACLYQAVETSSEQVLDDVRLRALLGLSGVQLQHDTALMDLHTYRGIEPALLEDAGLELRVFAVVDALETGSAATLAQQLLKLDAVKFGACVTHAQTQTDLLVEQLVIDQDEAADWSHNIWILQQTSLAGQALAGCTSHAELYARHLSVSRVLFSSPPLVFYHDEGEVDRFLLLGDEGVAIPRDSATSVIALMGRTQGQRVVEDQSSLPVVDRQLLRRLGAEEGVVAGRASTVIVCDADEDSNVQLAATLYLDEIERNLPYDQTELAALSATDNIDDNTLEQFRQAEEQRLKEIVHEANNPLSIVRNYLHILELSLGSNPDAKDQLQLISRELKRTSDIIAQARDVPNQVDADTEAETEQDAFEVTNLDLVGWLKDIAALHSGAADRRDVYLIVNAPSLPTFYQVAEGRLSQIIANLTKNAVEASPQSAQVTLSLANNVYRNGELGNELSVTDQAGGLPERVLRNLGQPQVSAKGEEHQGLGLKIVVDLCREIGAELDVASSSVGTTFRVFLPTREEPSS